MKITVFGAGAIGGLIAGKIAASGQDCTLVARGETVGRLQASGLSIHERGQVYEGRPTVLDSADTASAGPQDIVILATKAHHLEAALPAITPLVGPQTIIVPAINGIPWWYTHGTDRKQIAERTLVSVDPGGKLAAALPAAQMVGCVVYIAADIPRPGTINSVGPRRLMLGDVATAGNAMSGKVAKVLEKADFRAPFGDDIRQQVWVKLWGNIHANPISVLTAATMEQTIDDPHVRAVSRTMMAETEAVASALDIDLGMSIDERLDQGKGLGAFKTSMLQDFEKGRSIELDAILGAVIELADWLSIDTPMLKAIYGLTRLRAITAGCYEGPA